MPVPPPAAVKRPDKVFAKVMVLPEPVMVVEAVKPLKAVEDVARVTVPPVCVWPVGPRAVMAEVRYEPAG